MKNEYIINEWALVRKSEKVYIPDKLDIHLNFLKGLDRDEFKTAFKYIFIRVHLFL